MRDLSNKDRLINGPVEYPEFRLRWFLISVAGRKVVFQVCEVCAIQKLSLHIDSCSVTHFFFELPTHNPMFSILFRVYCSRKNRELAPDDKAAGPLT